MHNLHKGIKMDSLMPALFHEIYRKRFGATYDVAQESTWHWLTVQHISDFYAPAYTRSDPPSPCITLHEGHRPKMFYGWWRSTHLCSATCAEMTAMDSWFWVMSSCFWHTASAAGREGEAEDCAAQAQPPCIGCPCAPSKPWSMQCERQTRFSWNAWHGWCLTI